MYYSSRKRMIMESTVYVVVVSDIYSRSYFLSLFILQAEIFEEKDTIDDKSESIIYNLNFAVDSDGVNAPAAFLY